MENDKPKRTEAQKAADKRYYKKNPNRAKNIVFRFSAQEAEKIDNYLNSINSSKVDFLRNAISAHKEKKF